MEECIEEFYQFEVIKFPLNHKDHWNLLDLQVKHKDYCFRLTIKDNIYLSQINELVTRFSVRNLGAQKRDLLFYAINILMTKSQKVRCFNFFL